jgi:hypothetical protein
MWTLTYAEGADGGNEYSRTEKPPQMEYTHEVLTTCEGRELPFSGHKFEFLLIVVSTKISLQVKD